MAVIIADGALIPLSLASWLARGVSFWSFIDSRDEKYINNYYILTIQKHLTCLQKCGLVHTFKQVHS